MATSVGRIDLDLGINRKGLQKEVKSVGKMMGHTLSVAVGNMFANLAQSAIKNLGGFFKSSIELGSSIAELENVTSTVFPSMQQQVEEFSKSALQQYGLTEMQTKKMMGTFGAMAQAFKYSEKEAYNMSAALTGLVGDVSSFYNLDHDVAYTKIKSVFTGETESLKDLGIVMTQTALDEYALANSFGKTTAQMSEQEKVALRMAFVTDQLSFAAGDFAKTQNQWANQTRILAGQWDSFKSAIGQGFIAVLTPLIQGLNKVMAVVVTLGQKLRDFIYMIMGKDIGSGVGSVMNSVAEATEGAAGAAGAASDSTAKSAKKASKAAKDIKNSVLGFDQLNKLTEPPSDSDSDSDGGGGGGGAGGGFASGMSSLPVQTEAETALSTLDEMKQKLETIANWTGFTALWEGINSGIQLIDFSAIQTNFSSIMDSLAPIAQLSVNAISVVLNSIGSYVGTAIGQVIAMSGAAIEIGTGAIALWLSTESETITTWIATTALALSTGFDNLTYSSEVIFGSFWAALTENQGEIEGAIATFIGSFTGAKMTIGGIFVDMWAIATESIKNFVINNKPEIDTFFSGIMSIGVEALNSVSAAFTSFSGVLKAWWDGDGKTMWSGLTTVFTELMAWVLRLWNEVLSPVILALFREIGKLWTETLAPLWKNVLNLISAIGGAIKAWWDEVLKPVLNWAVTVLGPAVSTVCTTIIEFVGNVLKSVGGIIGGVIGVFTGLINFLVGTFTGDFDTAMKGISGIFGGVIEVFKSLFGGFVDSVSILLKGAANAFIGIINGLTSGINKAIDKINAIPGVNIPKIPQIPKLAEGGYVRANQPQLAIIGDNKHHGEIVTPENKMYEVVSAALQSFMGQLIAALSSGSNSQGANEMMQLIIQIGEETIVNRIIKRINSESRRQGSTVIKV